MSTKYWENETPIVADTSKNIFRYFSEAGKLQISMPYWTDGDGNQKPGKTVTVDISVLKENADALELIRQIVGGVE